MWCRPSPAVIKVNFDALVAGSGVAGLGLVAHNQDACVLPAASIALLMCYL